ncbi:MAG: class I SAM-dependent methyltransferase [Candidatus Brocadiia bacterium]
MSVEGFEVLDAAGQPGVDYVYDASKPLPFSDETFELIHASHVLEHIPWYKIREVLREWTRILQRGGQMEIWVPDGLKVSQVIVDYENNPRDKKKPEHPYPLNPEREPCKWADWHLFGYGAGVRAGVSANWHRALFTPRYLKEVMQQVGLKEISKMDRSQARGPDHGWINLGVSGKKPEKAERI